MLKNRLIQPRLTPSTLLMILLAETLLLLVLVIAKRVGVPLEPLSGFTVSAADVTNGQWLKTVLGVHWEQLVFAGANYGLTATFAWLLTCVTSPWRYTIANVCLVLVVSVAHLQFFGNFTWSEFWDASVQYGTLVCFQVWFCQLVGIPRCRWYRCERRTVAWRQFQLYDLAALVTLTAILFAIVRQDSEHSFRYWIVALALGLAMAAAATLILAGCLSKTFVSCSVRIVLAIVCLTVTSLVCAHAENSSASFFMYSILYAWIMVGFTLPLFLAGCYLANTGQIKDVSGR
ncbi:MAG: hypothetical protein AAGA03_07920 [Planctomycetota bacterium]